MAHLSQDHIQNLYNTFGELKVLDDIIRHRAADQPPTLIIGYPRYQNSAADYELFTGKKLDRYIDAAVKHYLASGLKPDTQETVALLAPSNLDFIVSFFALSRLGFTLLLLSLRIQPLAIVNLLQKANCQTIIRGRSPQVTNTVLRVIEELPLRSKTIAVREDYDKPDDESPYFVRIYDREVENTKIALILHSSGSTGLPKPIFLSHRAILCHPPQGSGYSNFNALPWYHLYGLSTCFQAMWVKKTAYLYNTDLPLTAENLVAAIEASSPEAVHSVPYALGLLAESSRGVELMKHCKIVTAAGARTPDELGDRLVGQGINLGVVFGTTEAGLLGDTMRREKDDHSWNYIRIYSNIRKCIYMNPISDGQYECVYLKGHPALSTSNSDVPAAGSWYSKDVFEPHPTIPDVWKYTTRVDDRVTLLNGEKVLPLPIEGRLREDKLVREAVVVGVDRPIPGLLIFRAKEADTMSSDEYIDTIWPSISDANATAEAFSQITREMITVLPSDLEYPQTDKKSIIRGQVYVQFASQINEMYDRNERNDGGGLKFDSIALENYLMKAIRETMGLELDSIHTDFFSAGVDSLKAIQLRTIIQKHIDLRGTKLANNIVYEKGNVANLAHYLYALGSGKEINGENNIHLMRQLIMKYSSFEKPAGMIGPANGFSNGTGKPNRISVMLTGATGSIGAHVLAQLLTRSEIERIYCHVRGTDSIQRIRDSLEVRGLSIPSTQLAKVVTFGGDLSSTRFGLQPTFYNELQHKVSLIIHIAWPVNFNISLSSFEPHIAGLNNLLRFSLSVHSHDYKPAQLLFCSSISTAFSTPQPAIIPDGPIRDLSHASGMGYGQSKLIGEHMVLNANISGANAYVLRIGQVVGDTKNGIWNDKEFIPSVIRSAMTLKALPMLEESCSWLPVDTLATAILQLSSTISSSTKSPQTTIYNVLNPISFPWSSFLDTLTPLLPFPITRLSTQSWLQILRESAPEPDNPALKLIEYFEQHFGKDQVGDGEAAKHGGIKFSTEAICRDALVMRGPVRYIEDGHVQRLMERWMERWAWN